MSGILTGILRNIHFKENFSMKVNLRITVRDLDGNVTETFETHNSQTYAGKNFLRDLLGNIQTVGIQQFAWGTSNTTPTLSDTQLNAEAGRKPVTAFLQNSTGIIDVRTLMLGLDGVGTNMQEFGLFGGTAATGSTNTGILVAHALWSHTKLITESIQFDWSVTIS